jgi:hypothetical protein
MVTSNVKANGAYAVNKAIRQVIKSQFGNVIVKGRKYSETASNTGNPNNDWRYKWYRVAPAEMQKMSQIKEYVDTIAPAIEATTGVKVRCNWKHGKMGSTSMLLVTKNVKNTPIRNRKK